MGLGEKKRDVSMLGNRSNVKSGKKGQLSHGFQVGVISVGPAESLACKC